MNEQIKKILYKSLYESNKGRQIALNEATILESKKTESEALNILNKNNVDGGDDVLSQFKNIDKTKNQILLPMMSSMFVENNNIQQTIDLGGEISELLNKGKLKSIQSTKRGYVVNNDKTFPDFLKLSEFIHSLTSLDMSADKTSNKKGEKVNTENGVKPIWENDNFAIYDGNNIETCIMYGHGALTNKTYSFCIGNYGSGNMWQSYRDNNGASFYYILDKTKTTDNPFHIVVWMPLENGQLLLTHERNSTQTEENFNSQFAESEFGMGYREYLTQNGVPIDKILKTVPKTPEENIKNKLISNKISGVKNILSLGKQAKEDGMFPELSEKQASYKMFSDYIGRGHLLDLEQFNFLYDSVDSSDASFTLLKKYLDTGQAIPDDQFRALTSYE